MHFIFISSLVFSIQISIMQAACNKSPQESSSNDFVINSNTMSSELSSMSTTISSTAMTNTTPSINSTELENQYEPHSIRYNSHNVSNNDNSTIRSRYNSDGIDLGSLRIEYNKFKILSNLGIESNPDLLAPSGYDKLLQLNTTKQLISDFERLNLANDSIRRRNKRSLPCSQVKSDKDACCLETFYVNFTEIGWDKWILYPPGYTANYCRGQCDLSHARYYHSTLLSKFSHVIGLCCSPRRMAPLQLLYIDDNNKVLLKTVPDMIVESCDCA